MMEPDAPRPEPHADAIAALEAVPVFPGETAYAKGVRTGMSRAIAYLREPRRLPPELRP